MKKVIIPILIVLLLTSCWDATEIEEIGFVLAVAVDPISKEELAEYQRKFKKETGKAAGQMYKTTYQIVIPSMVAEDRPGHEEFAFFNISTVGRTNFKMNRHISARRSRRLNYEHLKVVILNGQLLKTGELGKFIDFYLRDHEMRRDSLFFVSKEDASEALECKLPLELMPAISITMIQENYTAHHGMPAPTPIGDVGFAVLAENSYIVPRITSKLGKEIVITGAGVFLGETNELIGWLGEEDVEAYKLVVGEAENLVIETTLNDQLFNYELDNFDSSIDYQLKDGQDFFEINLKAEGFFVENLLEDIDLSEDEMNEKLEAAVEKEVERLASNIVEKMQTEFHADIFKMLKIVKNENYQRWKKIKDEWDEEEGYFSKANIEINVVVNIRHHMTKQQIM